MDIIWNGKFMVVLSRFIIVRLLVRMFGIVWNDLNCVRIFRMNLLLSIEYVVRM